ncbi:MAG: hypothetical protein GDA49_07050 [Rhodospirillales bacterium]|nr:hypothetical protein [Rhodospirillales bacterium]
MLPAFEEPEIPQPTDVTRLRPLGRSRSVVTDLASGRTDFVLDEDDGVYRIESHGTTVDQLGWERQSIVDGDPLSYRGEVGWRIVQERDDWKTMVEAVTVVTCDAVSFHVETRIVAEDAGQAVLDQTFQRAIPRDLM